MVCRLPNIWFIHGQQIPYGIKLFIKVRIGRMDFTDQHKNSLHQLLTIWLIIHCICNIQYFSDGPSIA